MCLRMVSHDMLTTIMQQPKSYVPKHGASAPTLTVSSKVPMSSPSGRGSCVFHPTAP